MARAIESSAPDAGGRRTRSRRGIEVSPTGIQLVPGAEKPGKSISAHGDAIHVGGGPGGRIVHHEGLVGDGEVPRGTPRDARCGDSVVRIPTEHSYRAGSMRQHPRGQRIERTTPPPGRIGRRRGIPRGIPRETKTKAEARKEAFVASIFMQSVAELQKRLRSQSSL